MLMLDRQMLLSAHMSRSETRAQFMLAVTDLLREFELDHISIISAPDETDVLLAPLVLETTLPLEFAREYDRKRYLTRCPIVPRMSDSNVPQAWHLDSTDPDLIYDCPEPLRDLMRRFNLLFGMVFPLNSIDTRRFYIRYDAARAPLERHEFNELAMLTVHAFDSYDRLRRAEAATPVSLSVREVEVIRWTAQGKTSVEIGQILSLSDHTINAYMTNAMRKLNCVNRTQLVAEAIRKKLIN